jgi:hypothetical protein
MGDEETIKDIEWENRVLCSDEGCIGVVGEDGRCNECGRYHEGRPAPSNPQSADEDADRSNTAQIDNGGERMNGPAPSVSQTAEASDVAANATASADVLEDAPAAPQADSDDWGQRTLCRDEACIGVIGPDGRCKECGLPYR